MSTGFDPLADSTSGEVSVRYPQEDQHDPPVVLSEFLQQVNMAASGQCCLKSKINPLADI